jgi:formylglycine-generating enzyme required for sulfatase activity
MPKKILICYSKQDSAYLADLQKHLKPLQRSGLIQPWDDTKLLAGEDWDKTIKTELSSADIVILLVSVDMIATDYVWEIEMPKAIERHNAGEAIVIPVIIRPCDWEDLSFGLFNALPHKGKPVSSYTNPDKAWTQIVKQIKGSLGSQRSLVFGDESLGMSTESVDIPKDQAHLKLNKECRRLKTKDRTRHTTITIKSAEDQRPKTKDPTKDLEMITIQGGTFLMGDVLADNEYDEEKPTHSVTLSGFQMGKYPVSQAQWQAIMGENPAYFRGDDLPIEQVSWEDVQEFIKKLNRKTRKKYRLPTEAEWEYAAREGGKKTRFGNGRLVAKPNRINFDCNRPHKKTYSEVGEYIGKSTPVDTYRPNSLGLCDMSGNVWEWCSDWYGDYGKSATTNPKGVAKGINKIIRGGSWCCDPRRCRVAYRYAHSPTYRSYDLGFRLAMS